MIFAYLGAGLVSAVLVYGLTLAYFQRQFLRIAEEMYGSDVAFATFFSVAAIVVWPMVLPLVYFLSERARYGLMFTQTAR